MNVFDLIIIGGGPSGLNVAISAKKAGLRYLVLEKGVLAHSIYHFPANMTFFSTSVYFPQRQTNAPGSTRILSQVKIILGLAGALL